MSTISKGTLNRLNRLMDRLDGVDTMAKDIRTRLREEAPGYIKELEEMMNKFGEVYDQFEQLGEDLEEENDQ